MVKRAVFVCIALLWQITASAQTTVNKGVATRAMAEGFGSGVWLSTPARMPRDGFYVNRGKPATFFGAVFGTGERVMLLNPTNVPRYTRYGYFSSVPVLPGIEVEARINTMAQGGRVIDVPFELWLVSTTDPSKFVSININAVAYGAQKWAVFMGIEEVNNPQSFPYCQCSASNTIPFDFANDTWYRFRITDTVLGNTEVSIWSDDGTQKLVSHTFNYPLSEVGSRMYVGFSQMMGTPDTPTYDSLVAIDSLTVRDVR